MAKERKRLRCLEKYPPQGNGQAGSFFGRATPEKERQVHGAGEVAVGMAPSTPLEGSFPRSVLATAKAPKGITSQQSDSTCVSCRYWYLKNSCITRSKMRSVTNPTQTTTRAIKPFRHENNMSAANCKADSVCGQLVNHHLDLISYPIHKQGYQYKSNFQ